MIYLEYGRDLPNKVNKKNNLPHEFEPFTHWHVKPIKIDNKECYLLMEHDTKFWVILTKLNILSLKANRLFDGIIDSLFLVCRA